ncbi:MAG: PKD domain-containing protein [Saprospiraceae bacterium]|jgi:PKD repeat protein/subtilase family serine protease/pimeloyl-ACP methyl ester carboxylesterase|nr:PKD domain-containing protein [Saprospiraceae bacterium]
MPTSTISIALVSALVWVTVPALCHDAARFSVCAEKPANAAQIVAYEYWFDQNHAQRVFVAVSPTDELHLNLAVPTADLANGLHTLHVRFLDDSGQWSSVLSQFFTKLPAALSGERQITAYRYWFDNAPAQAVEVPVGPAAEVAVLADLSTAGLANGLHTLHLRFRDDAGQWSSVLSQFFTKLPAALSGERQITAYQYWFDNASAQAVEVPVGPAAEVAVLADLSTAVLANGLHTLHLRFRDDAGQWSSVLSQFFTKLPAALSGERQITTYQYWFDNASAQAVEVPVGPAAEVAVLTDLPTTGLTNGLHTLHLRFRDDAGQWSSVLSQFFTKLATGAAENKIAGYRYWLDLNFPDRVEVTLPQPVELLVLDDALDLAAYANAPHVIHFQFIDLNGAWSAVVSDTFNLGEPPQASFAANAVPCKNGQVAFVNTSSFATNWLWNFGDGHTSTEIAPVHTYATPGTYQVTLTATDATTGFSNTYTAPVEAQFLALVVVIATTPSTCPNTNDGSATATVSNGIAPYGFIWSNGMMGEALNGLVSGAYTVTVTDANGCTGVAGENVGVTYDMAFSIDVQQPATCLTAANGVAYAIIQQDGPEPYTYTYLWSNGETGEAATQLPVGNISVVVSDAAGCTVEAQGYMIPDPFLIAELLVVYEPRCADSHDGGAVATLLGLSLVEQPFTYLWSNGETEAFAEHLPGGLISVSVTDANGCSAVASTVLNAPPPLSAQVNVVDATCHDVADGAATVVVQNGTAPYEFVWSNGMTGEALNGLASGAYTVTVTDANGCTGVAGENVGVTSELAVGIEILTPASCLVAVNGVAYAYVQQEGVEPYTYLWSNGETGGVASQLPVGDISVVVTDAVGCTFETHGEMIPDPFFMAEILLLEEPHCVDSHDGSAVANLIGSAPVVLPFMAVLWSNGETEHIAEHLPGGLISVSITDANGCSAVASTVLNAPPPLSAQANVVDISCALLQDGTATAVPGGGVPPYQVEWSNGAVGASISNLGPGTYSASVIDANGCSAVSDEFVVAEPEELAISLQPTNASCGTDGSIATSVTGGTPPYSFAWSNGATMQNLMGLAAGYHELVVTDAHLCVASASTTIQALNHAPTFDFTGNTGFEAKLVDPASGSPYQTYRYEVRYFDTEGELPQPGYPRLYLDYEGDGNLFGAYDQSYVLTPVDANDLDVADGKDYFAVLTGVPPSPNYKTVVRAMDVAGCQGELGPISGPFIVDQVDVFLFANDIQFSKNHPDPLDTITVTAMIHNESDFAAENFVCRLTNLNTGQVFAPITVASLPAHSTTQIGWTVITPPDPSWNPMRVELDMTNVLDESNELNNQAIRPYLNGDYNLPGSISTVAAVASNPSVVVPASSLNLSGSAVYVGASVPLGDSSCAGASVFFTLLETGQSFAGFTNESGYFSIYFPQPPTPGTYHITGTVTDYTFEGAFSTTFTVTPLPCVKPDLICQLEPSRYSLVQGDTLGGKVRISNVGTDTSVATRVRLTAPVASPFLAFVDVPPLSPGAFVDVNMPVFVFPSVGTTFLHAQVDDENLNDECQEGNNLSGVPLTVTPALPDIVPVWWNLQNPNLPLCSTHTFIYQIENRGGAATGPFAVKWEVWNGNGLENEFVQTVSDIPPGGMVFVHFPYTFSNVGTHWLDLLCDWQQEVSEHTDLNNNFYGSVNMYACPIKPDLRFESCETLEVSPADPIGLDTITVNALLANRGNAVAIAPFEVELTVVQQDVVPTVATTYLLTIADDLAPNQTVPVLFKIPQPPAGNNTLQLVADAGDQVEELNETNNQFADALDWDFSLGKYCVGLMFWERPVTTPNVWFSVGLFNAGQFEASEVQVQFEISGPGLNGWVNLGNAVVNYMDKTCSSCPASAVLPNPFTFLTTGTYLVRMTADPDNQYPESNEADNVLVVEVHIRPDLRILSQYIAPSELHPDADEPLLFTVSYDNIGFSNPTDSMELFLYVDGLPWDSVRVPGLLSGDFYSVQFPEPWKSNIVGAHVARAAIDHDGEILETDEFNNDATRAIVVGEAPNLRFAGFSVNDNQPILGQPLVLTAVIQNNGDLTGSGTYQAYYVSDSGDTIPIGTPRNFTLPAEQQQTFTILWPVADANTVLIGKILNSNPLEFRYDDNIISTVIGGLNLSVTTTPERCIPYTGTATATVAGGIPPYFYGWVTGQTGQTITGLGAGNYALTVTDVQGVSAVAYFPVAHKPQPELTFAVTKASCDKNDGGVSVAVQHAQAPIELLWSTGATTAELSGLVPALYALSVTDALGCSATADVVVGFDALKPGSSGTCVVATPWVGLQKGVVNTGQTQTISGRLFFPNGRAIVRVAGVQTELLSTQVNTDADGVFVLEFTVPVGTPIEQYTVAVRDVVSNASAPDKHFQVIDPTPPVFDGIRITRPLTSAELDGCSTQTIEWEERLVRRDVYPYTGHYRQYHYVVEMSRSNGPWEYLGKDDGYASFGSGVHRSYDYETPKPGTTYRLRVRDYYDSDNFAISSELQSVPSATLGNCALEWDYSYHPHPGGHPRGVAADGTARVYLVADGYDLVSATVMLADNPLNDPPGSQADTTTLGRVMVATITDAYSEEANSANQVVATGQVQTDNKVWFWYVAPDDFVRKPTDADLGRRKVYAILIRTFGDGSKDTSAIPIEVVRPPLMLVHGLFGGPESWDKFGVSNNDLLIHDKRFLVRKAIKIGSTDSFDSNAERLVLANGATFGMAGYPCFQSVIHELRDIYGYASNRLDYIGHSMGGSVLRQVLTGYMADYKASNRVNYKNYNRGYVNKAITIGTPHHGSPLADMVVRYANKLAGWVAIRLANTKNHSPQDFMHYFIIKDQIGDYLVPPAVRDLQISGGKSEDFSEANINSHVIGTDIIPGENYLSRESLISQSFLDDLDQSGDILDGVDWMLKSTPLFPLQPGLTKVKRTLDFIQFFADALNYAVFFSESDFVVHLKSQLAGRSRYDKNTTSVVDKVAHSSPLNWLGFNIQLKSAAVANHASKMLNAPVAGGNFAPFLPTPSNFLGPDTYRSNTDDCLVSITIPDTTHLKIRSIPSPAIAKVDSQYTVIIQMLDTVDLDWAEVYFQGKSYELPTNFVGAYQFDFSVGAGLLDSQEVTLLAHFTRNDSCIAVYQTQNIFVQAAEPLIGFEVFPEVNYLFVGESISPRFRAVFPSGNTGETLFSTAIANAIDDTSRLAFSTANRQFAGKSAGETFVVFSYQGFQDTAYFIVLPALDGLTNEPPPMAFFEFSESVACIGGAVHLENKSLNADSYLWEFGDGSTSTEISPSHTYSQPGYHQVFLTATNTQTGQSVKYFVAIEVEQDSIGVSIVPEADVPLCAGVPVTLTATSTPGLSFQWQINGFDLVDSVSATITVDSAGTYQVVVTNPDGCTATSNAIVLDVSCNTILSGTLFHKGDGVTGLAQADVHLSGDAITSFGPTPATGAYSISPGLGSTYTITPRKQTVLLNGVDAADATAIQRHLTGSDMITDFFRLVAADVNWSNSISSVDAALIRQCLLGNPSALAIWNSTKSWRFIPTSYVLPDPVEPYTLPPFPMSRSLTNASGAISGLDFYGVKVGDVFETGNTANPANKLEMAAEPLIWSVPNQPIRKGGSVTADFQAINFDNLSSFQTGLVFDSEKIRFEYIEVLYADLPLDASGNFGLYNVTAGELRILWAITAGKTLGASTPVFRIHFTALADAGNLEDVLALDNAVLQSIAYDADLVPRELLLAFADFDTTNQAGEPLADQQSNVQLLQNRPNPFSESTLIGFILPNSCDIQLRILDLQGRELMSKQKTYSAGYHEELVKLSDLRATGVLYYQLRTPYGTLTRKMTALAP